jgi:hypothetical protein
MPQDYQRPASRLGPLFWLVLMILTAALIAVGVRVARAQTLPTLPLHWVDTTYTPPTSVVNVPAGGNLQAAINSAPLGTLILIPAGATFGPVSLPAKSGTGWIYIQSTGTLPLPNNRVTPAQSAQLAKLSSPLSAVVTTQEGAHHYRFIGIEFISTNTSTTQTNFGLVQIDVASGLQPHHIIVDRSYCHGTTSGNLRRCVTMNGGDLAVIDSTVTEVHEVGADSQATWTSSGTGPFKVVNNRLEAAGENIMFGGDDPHVTNQVPADFEIRGNYAFKPLAWKTASWTVKNLIEVKNGQRFLFEGNIGENNWESAQNGFSILITPRNQNGGCPSCGVWDVTFRLNQLINGAQGFNISGEDDEKPSAHTRRVFLQNNLIGLVPAASDGRVFQVTHSPIDLTIDHNTGATGKSMFSSTDQTGGKPTGFVFTNNTVIDWFLGQGTGNGNPTLAAQYSNPVFTANAILAARASDYPVGNFFPPNLAGATQIGTDGKVVGVDATAMAAATSCTISGQCASGVPPPQDTTPPVVTITSPTSGQTFQTGTPIPLVATATDNQPGVSAVSWAANGQSVVSPYTPLSAGAVTLVATARDAAGNVGASSVSLTIAPGPPQPPTPIPCSQGAWVLASLTQSGAGFTATFSRPTLTAPQNGGAGCGPSQQTFTVVIGG